MISRKLIISIPVAALMLALLFNPAGEIQAQENEGHLEGVVEPAEANAVVWVIEDAEVAARIDVNPENGEFSQPVPAGTYQVYVEPQEEGYVIYEVPNVEIESGEATDLGTIDVEE